MPTLLKTELLKQYDVNQPSNGCGNGYISWFMAKLAQKLVNVRLQEACKIHDKEWSIPNKYKSVQHWKESNYNFLYNCILLCGTAKQSARYRFKLRVVALFYTAVMLNTYSDYLGR